ncbi:hypothetical protein RA307_09660 [Xanthobacteraceae bacterium Astr-EGSB]|uniref:hypothetical protein n=1 Tax=Astrobacterium formosum TaxID=3069710 RepID=UPI0027B70DBD|nr:hypothetical protein [Xanthobacteraceae bacterium Astr-EGSB]
MTTRLIVTLFVTSLAAGLVPAAAQTPGEVGAPRVRLAQSGPVPPVAEEDQISPRQIQQENRRPTRTPATQTSAPKPAAPMPAPKPRAAQPAQADARPTTGATAAAAAARPAARISAPRTISCSGVFGRESTHLKLAIAFDSKNLVFTEVDGPEGSKLNASVLFPNDPKRRLEVLWQNEASRADTSLIVIGGKSQWTGPKNMRLGMTLAALEKANGKPFSLSGLDQDNGGSVLDWKGGAMASLPGGCKVGVRFAADAKAKDEARAAAAGKELNSNDAVLKPARLTVTEIILGY